MAQKKFTQDGNQIIVDAAYNDGAGNNIVSQYSTKQELTTKASELELKITEAKGTTYTKSEIDTKDTAVATTAAEQLAAHTGNSTIHITAAERTAWNAKYDKPTDGIPASHLEATVASNISTAYNHSQEGTGTGKTHHILTVVPMSEETEPYISAIDSTDLAARFDNVGHIISATYATKTECNAKYTKPDTNIPKSDLAATVQDSLNKADAAQPATDSSLATTAKTIVGAINELNSGKQANIEDLSTIRSGAALGTTSLQIADKTELATSISQLNYKATNHINSTENPHAVTKAQVGLGNVDNTSDANKPISTATQTALDAKQATISDLADIRSGAAAGVTAVQPSAISDMATKTEVANTYQAKIIAGTNISIAADGKTLSATDTTYTAGANITITDGVIAATDTVYTAGANVTISGNEISATDTTYVDATTTNSGLMSAADKVKLNNLSTITMQTLTTPNALTASTAIGAITQGTVIPAGTSLWSILHLMFEGTTAANYFYCGTMSELPTTDADITGSATMTRVECDSSTLAALTGTGYSKTLRPNTEYIVFAIEQACNLTLSELDINSSPNSFASLSNTGTMYLYCVGDDNGSPVKVGDGTVDVEYNFICN